MKYATFSNFSVSVTSSLCNSTVLPGTMRIFLSLPETGSGGGSLPIARRGRAIGGQLRDPVCKKVFEEHGEIGAVLGGLT